jgi:hypothetical protein
VGERNKVDERLTETDEISRCRHVLERFFA